MDKNMKKLIVKVVNKIEEIKQNEREYQEIVARARARKAREEFYNQMLAERAERLRKQADEQRRLQIQRLIDEKLKEEKKA